MSRVVDLSKMPPFGRLKVMCRNGSNDKGRAMWKCQCKCGKIVVILGSSLRTGNTTSCGCLRTDFLTTGVANRRHGLSRTPTYEAWKAMFQRCYNPKHKSYGDYGGRGITVCERWRESFDNFLADMGERPKGKHSIDRFPNQNGNYEPGNCRWATWKEQHRNRRNNMLVTSNGVTKTAPEWSEETGVTAPTIKWRAKRKKPIDTPVKKSQNLLSP